ncbi:glycosyltransferase [Acinetobacter sp. VNH17]|uniref:Glycosyltransferase n=1 Tax=Acinetobacter thutiue TaxID=2998078 RepID=A0ABT7WP98_9GAMM|nr:glycosyltransferase [Acinetobacter thutiue]MCY6412408.1 glycosyltransferase [Acinetobacter thutiue]MDN0014512.1 glycosyltransferase [Acinetobacter thutiue]
MIKSEDFDEKISIITAVYNEAKCIHHLIDSLRQQTDQNFEWVVVDGHSTDNTLEILKQINDLNIKIISDADFGIYDALNKGIKTSTGEYYLVAGADDIFFPNAIADYKAVIETNVDMITAFVIMGDSIIKPRGYPWLFGQKAFISNHALGVLIRKSLHLNHGFYSNKFPIAADQLFIQKCALDGVKFKKIDKLIGEFSLAGISSTDSIGALSEFFRIQVMMGKNKWIQYVLYILKLLKRVNRLKV